MRFCGSVRQRHRINAVPLATLTGRFEFLLNDGNRTIIPGSIDYGTNYHVWDNDVFDTVRLGTIDTTRTVYKER